MAFGMPGGSMLWLLAIHMIAMLAWGAGLLYLPVLLAGVSVKQAEISEHPRQHDSLARFLFTQITTPAALVAIISGTVYFLLDGNTEPWLIAKLTLVAGLVVCHALTGLLVLRAEREVEGPLTPWPWIQFSFSATVMALIVWLVLAKPSLEHWL